MSTAQHDCALRAEETHRQLPVRTHHRRFHDLMEPPCLDWETLNVPELELEPGLGVALPLPPPLLHAAATTMTAIPRLAVAAERGLNPMAFTYSR